MSRPRVRTLADLDEQGLVGHLARHCPTKTQPLVLGIGDDAALLLVRPRHQLVATTDLAIEGIDFVAGAFPDAAVGHRALAQNLSDLAAMGATPLGFLLGLAAPPATALARIDAMARGMGALAWRLHCPLAGGDLSSTAGPLVLSITALGEVPTGRALRREGARPGDELWVSGHLGGAQLGLALALGQHWQPGVKAAHGRAARQALLNPEPRLTLGVALRGIASACIDISDGLLRDLERLAAASHVGVAVDALALPRAPGCDVAQALTSGEEYELLFTAPVRQHGRLTALAARLGVPLSCIGRVNRQPGVALHGSAWPVRTGFEHFATPRRRRGQR